MIYCAGGIRRNNITPWWTIASELALLRKVGKFTWPGNPINKMGRENVDSPKLVYIISSMRLISSPPKNGKRIGVLTVKPLFKILIKACREAKKANKRKVRVMICSYGQWVDMYAFFARSIL